MESDNKSRTNQLAQMDFSLVSGLFIYDSVETAANEIVRENIRASRRRRAIESGLENLRPSRRALRVCLILLKENDLLYIPALPGADFDPTDYGRSPEYYALELALCLYYRTPLPPLPPPPPVYSTPAELASQITDEELAELLDD